MAANDKTTISAVLIVKNEEDVLEACLDSVTWADEIVVYDTGSSDATRDLARQYTDLVIEGYWDDDFGAARNRAQEHARSEWVLSIDADEAFEGDAERLRRHLGDDAVAAYEVVIDDGAPSPFAPRALRSQVKIFRRAAYRWHGALHEQSLPIVSVGAQRPLPGVRMIHGGYRVDGATLAKGKRNLAIAEAELARASEEGVTGGKLAILRANAARSLAGAGHRDEGLAAAEEIWASGEAPALTAEHLARAMVGAAVETRRDDLVTVWMDRWLSVAGNPAWVYATQAQLAAVRKDAEAALAALDRVPTTVVDAQGRRLHRRDYAATEVWALASVGRQRDARRIAVEAAKAGRLPGRPAALLNSLGEAGVEAVLRVLPDSVWRLCAMLCVQDSEPGGRAVLRTMDGVRPGDLTVLVCASMLAPAMDLDEAVAWSTAMRERGLGELCPLVRIALDEERDPRVRALAAAIAVDAGQDSRALPALEDALAQVQPEDEADLLSQLDVVAPGLVMAGV
jgi:glycosyltransferase involved in cell wall biosynthesis